MGKKGLLICFTGIDGSGKTTLSKYLGEYLNTINLPNNYLWWFEAENSSIFRKFLRFVAFGNERHKKNNSIKQREHIKKNFFLSNISQILILFDYFSQSILKVRIPIFFGKTVICDRYIYDVIVSFAVQFNYSEKNFEKKLNTIIAIFPVPDLVFLLDVPEKISFSRKDDVFDPKHLSKPRNVYSRIRNECRYQNMLNTELAIIDGTRDLDDLKQEVIEKLFGLLETKRNE